MNMMRTKLIKAPLLLLLLFVLTSCGFWMLPLRREKSAYFAIKSADFSEAFDISVKAAKDISFDISEANKGAGRFQAERGFGLDEITVLKFQIRQGYRQKLYFIVTVKSSKGANSVINSFVKSVEKYMDTSPLSSPSDLEQ